MDNLIVNGNFENGRTDPWIKYNGVGTGVLSENSDSYNMFGTYMVKGGGGSGVDGIDTSWYQVFDVTTQSNFYFSGWFICTGSHGTLDDYARGSATFIDSTNTVLQRDYIHDESPGGPYVHFRDIYGSVPAGAVKVIIAFDTIRQSGDAINCGFDGVFFAFDQEGEEIKWKDEIVSRVTFQEESLEGGHPPLCSARKPVKWVTSAAGESEGGDDYEGPYVNTQDEQRNNNSRSLYGRSWIRTSDVPQFFRKDRPKGGTISFWGNFDVVRPFTLKAGSSAVELVGGIVKIKVPNNFDYYNAATNKIKISGTQNYDGNYDLEDNDSNENNIWITAPYVPETFTGNETVTLQKAQSALFIGDHEVTNDRLSLLITIHGDIRIYGKDGSTVVFDQTWTNDGSFNASDWYFFEVTLFHKYVSVKLNGTQILSDSIGGSSPYNKEVSNSIVFGGPYVTGSSASFCSFNIADITITSVEPLVYGKTILPTDIVALPPGPKIRSHPQDVYGLAGQLGVFTVQKEAGPEITYYQWYKNDELLFGETEDALEIELAEVTSPTQYWCKLTDEFGSINSRRAQAIVFEQEDEDEDEDEDEEKVKTLREAMVWNFEDNNFAWMDSSIDKISQLEDIICMRYQPDPGFITRWKDLEPFARFAKTWQDLTVEETRWADFYGKGSELNMYWLSDTGLYISDQVVKINGAKQYFVERVLIDLNEVVSDFTSDKWIYANQLYFHLKGVLQSENSNYFSVSVGWADTLNDEPDFLPLEKVNLQTRQRQGTVKHDFRSTGRYLALRFEFNETSEIQFTGAEINAEQTHGR